MRKLQRFTALASCLGLAVACSSSPEPIKQNPALMDPDAKAGYDPTAEEKRLRDMMAVRVVDSVTGDVTELDSTDFGNVVGTHCDHVQDYSGCPAFGCEQDECELSRHQCWVDVLVTAARGTNELTLKTFDQSGQPGNDIVVPPQSSATSAALAARATRNFGFGLATRAFESDCSPAALQASARFSTSTRGEYLASAFAELYFLQSEAYEIYRKDALAAADAQLGSTPIGAIAASRTFAGSDLSRSSVAHAFAGGADGYLGGTAAMCPPGKLNGSATAALSVLRESGLPPDYILALEPTASRFGLATIDSATMLNGSLPLGSVNQRLSYFMGEAVKGSVQAHFDLSTQDFEQARAWLAREIVAYARTRTATLSTESGPGKAPTSPATYAKFAGTATLPPARPAAYYSALARTNGVLASGVPDLSSGTWYEQNYMHFAVNAPFYSFQTRNFSVLHSEFIRDISRIINSSTAKAASNYAAIVSAVSMVERAGDSIGFLKLCETASTRTLSVAGFSQTDHLAVVRGEDALTCATTGSIEGAPCDASDVTLFELNVDATPPEGYQAAVARPVTSFFDEPARYYLLKPRKKGDSVAVGNAEALTGFIPYQLGTGQDACVEVPLIPAAEQVAKEALEPSPQNCGQSRTTCAGGSFDDRIPLEDELASDGDNIESSWKHYLAIAKAAAVESDRLGDEYVNSIIGSLSRDEEEDLRRIAREDRVAAELDAVQEICGTDIDPSSLLQALGMDSEGRLQAGDGSTGQPCTDPLPDGSYCLNGVLVRDWTDFLQSNDPDVQKLAVCLNDFENVTYAHMGDRTLCAWETPNGLCADNPDNLPCPTLEEDCEVPVGATRKELDDKLGFFSTRDTLGPPPTEDACDALRSIRERNATTEADVQAELDTIRKAGVFDKIGILPASRAISTKLAFGDYVSVKIGSEEYTTGSTAGGPSSTWPCGDSGIEDCSSSHSLFCWHASSCGDAAVRSTANRRLYRAALAALVIGDPSGEPRIEVPMYFSTAYPEVPGISGPKTRWALDSVTGQQFPFGEYSTEHLRHFEASALPPGFVLSSIEPNWINDAYEYYPYKLGELPYVAPEYEGQPIGRFGFVRLPLLGTRHVPNDLWEGLSLYSGDKRGSLLTLLLGGVSTNWTDDWLYSKRDEGAGTWVSSSDKQIGLPSYFSPTTPILEMHPARDRQAILDGLELLCASALKSSNVRTCNLDNAPELSSLGDLDRLGAHLQCMGDGIVRDSVYTVLKDLPRVALEPLVSQGNDSSGGEYAVAVSQLRTALLDIATSGPNIGRTMRTFGQDLKGLRATMAIYDLQSRMEDVKFDAEQASAIAQCASGGGASTFGSAAGLNLGETWRQAVSCMNAFAQVGFAEQLRNLGNETNEQQRQVAIADFNKRFTDHVTSLELEDIKLRAAFESAARQIVVISNLKQRARRSLSKAIWYATQQSEATAALNTGFDRKRDTARVRYEAAHQNAKRLSFLARRAVEQRIGASLDSMTNDLPLVDAPATWANSICATSGIDYSDVTGADGNSKKNYADSYIGDYVSKLENVVESYRLEKNFHEGTDSTLISLRDDIFGTKATCEVDSVNLLARPLDFDHPQMERNLVDPSWYVEGCAWEDVSDGSGNVVGRTSANCIDVVDAPDLDGDGHPDRMSPFDASLGQLRPVEGRTLRFGGPGHCDEGEPGCGYQESARLVQRLALSPGRYRFSFYVRDAGSLTAADYAQLLTVSGDGVAPLHTDSVPASAPGWNRVYVLFQVTQAAQVEVGIASSVSGARITDEMFIAGPQLDRVQLDVTDFQAEAARPAPLQIPDDNGKVVQASCPDQYGTTFRSVVWDYGCEKLCPTGYATSCPGSAVDQCYWEASFQLGQRAWEKEPGFGQGGFARGNFNYRIEDIGVNFVGQNLRDCSNSDSPDACYSNAYLPFSLYHVGPFYVRNYEGNDFEALLFDGKIEHARGLAAGRYLGNPLSSGDQQLLTPYIRQEFRGRPLDGMFRIRIWDEEGVDFNKLEDVQLMINYRYWTRNN